MSILLKRITEKQKSIAFLAGCFSLDSLERNDHCLGGTKRLQSMPKVLTFFKLYIIIPSKDIYKEIIAQSELLCDVVDKTLD